MVPLPMTPKYNTQQYDSFNITVLTLLIMNSLVEVLIWLCMCYRHHTHILYTSYMSLMVKSWIYLCCIWLVTSWTVYIYSIINCKQLATYIQFTSIRMVLTYGTAIFREAKYSWEDIVVGLVMLRHSWRKQILTNRWFPVMVWMRSWDPPI